MKYDHVVRGQFISRPNRFIANVLIGGQSAVAHVKNTGRCKELLVPGCTVYLAVSANPLRKTKYDVIGVEKMRNGIPLAINMDSQAANDAAADWLASGALFPAGSVIRREVTRGNSRFDFYIESDGRKIFLEVKGVTLEKDNVAYFPDAPTERGTRHVRELAACVKNGFEAYVLFVVQMKGMTCLRPNDGTDPAFGDALRMAAAAGVKILAVDCRIEPDGLYAESLIPVKLDKKAVNR